MKGTVLVTFARPEESRAFRKRLAGLRRCDSGGCAAWRGHIGNVPVVLVHTGIGPAAAERIARTVLAAEKVITESLDTQKHKKLINEVLEQSNSFKQN